MGEVGNIWIKIGAKIDEFEKNMSAVDKAMVKVGNKFQDVGKRLTIAGGAITAAIGAIVLKSTALGDQFDDLRQRTGIATETLSSFTLAVNKTDMGMTGFATALKFLANNMADANAGTKTAVDKFAMLGVSFKDAAGNLRPLDQVMLDVADKFKAMPDGAQKSALAVDLFGRAGTGMIHMLNLGRDGLQAEMDKAKELGLVFSGEASAASDKFQESLVDLKGSLQGLGNTITAAILPMVQNIITGVTNVIGKVREWAAEHPGLTTAIGGTALGIGGLMTALGTLSFGIGTVLKQIPTFIKGLNAIKAIALNPIVITIAVAIPVLTKAISDFKSEFNNMRDAMQEAGSSGFISFLEGVNSGFRKVALGIKDSNIVMSEANDKFISLKGAGIILSDAFNAVKGAFAAAVAPAAVLSTVFKDFGLKTKTELTAELKAAEAALIALRGSVESTPGQVEVLEGKIVALKEALSGSGEAAKNAAEEKKKFAESIQSIIDKANPEAAALRQVRADQEELNKATRAGVGDKTDLAIAMDRLVQAEAKLLTTTPQIKNALEDLAATNAKDVVPGLIDMAGLFPKIPEAAKPAVEQVKSLMQEMSTVVADAMRNIASAIVGAFNFKKLFGAVAIDIQFDSSAFDAMVEAANAAYDQITDASRRAFDQQELQISRAEEDADNRYQREYELQRKAIEDGVGTQKQKDAMLLALENQYEADKLARERAREDAKYLREEEQAKKLLQLQWDHEAELDKIRAAEELARDKQAQDELDRQNSLWFKVKGIFATAVEQMATIWLTKFIAKLIGSSAEAGAEIAKSIGGAVSGIGGAAGSMAGSFLSAASSIANIVTAVASVVSLLKSPPTGAADGMGRVVERQDQQTAILGSILEFQRNDERWGWQTSIKVLENIAYTQFKTANEYLKTIAAGIGNITGHAAGYSGVVSRPTLFVAGERGAEHVQVTPMRQSNTQPAIYITPVVIPRGDKYIIEFLTGAMRHGQMRVPAGAVGG